MRVKSDIYVVVVTCFNHLISSYSEKLYLQTANETWPFSMLTRANLVTGKCQFLVIDHFTAYRSPGCVCVCACVCVFVCVCVCVCVCLCVRALEYILAYVTRRVNVCVIICFEGLSVYANLTVTS